MTCKNPENAGNERPSLKVSLPISVWNNMQDRGAWWRTPIPNPTITRLRSMQPMQPMRPSESSNTPDLDMFRHPAPISSERALLVDHSVKTPKPTRAKSLPIISSDTGSVNKEPVIEQDTIQTEECDVPSKSKTPVGKNTLSNDSESPVQIKHKLPFTAVPHKGSYFKMPTTPINKENRDSSPHTKADQASQTDTCLIATEEEYKMLQIIKNNNLTITELINQLEHIEKKKQDKNNAQLIIDLESSPDEDSQKLYEKVMEQSTKNKSVLNKICKILHRNTGLTNSVEDQSQVRLPTAEAGATDNVSQPPCPTRNAFEPNDIQKGFALSTMLLQTGFRIVRIKPQSQGTQTDGSEDNNKKRKFRTTVEEDQSANEIGPFEQNVQPSHELPTLMTQQQEMPIFRAPNPARQQYAPEHIERSTHFYPNMSSVPHECAPYPSQKHHGSSTTAAHRSYQLSTGTATFNTPQTHVQMPSPVQPHINDPRRRSLYQMPKVPRLTRVLSTHEANMHGPQAQQQSWNYANYYNTHANMYPQSHSQ